jgi:ABC-type multidrug transport system permease subunit
MQMAMFRRAIPRTLGVTLGIALGVAAALSAVAATPALAQAVISEPGYCAFFYPYANCQNKGPGNPYTDPDYPRGPYASTWPSDQTVGVVGAAPLRRAHRRHAAAARRY